MARNRTAADVASAPGQSGSFRTLNAIGPDYHLVTERTLRVKAAFAYRRREPPDTVRIRKNSAFDLMTDPKIWAVSHPIKYLFFNDFL